MLIQMYSMAARAAKPVDKVSPTLCHMNQMTQAQERSSGILQKAMRHSLKLEARFVTHSEIEIRMKKKKAMPRKGKYQVTFSRHSPSLTM